MLHLGVSRHAYVTLQREIDTAAAEGRISSPITSDDANKLEYLQVSRSPDPFLSPTPQSTTPPPPPPRLSLTRPRPKSGSNLRRPPHAYVKSGLSIALSMLFRE
jgi:hypothetical protein